MQGDGLDYELTKLSLKDYGIIHALIPDTDSTREKYGSNKIWLALKYRQMVGWASVNGR